MGRNTPKSDADILKDIQSGKYRELYLTYNRKSTDEAESQKNSIDFQKKENLRFARQEGLQIADITIEGFCANGVIAERHSGFKEGDDLFISEDGLVQFRIDRPKFQRLVQLVNQGYIKGIICLCWDRISRNKGDDTVVRKLMKKGADIRFVHAQYEDSSSGELHMDIDGMFSQHHSRVTSEKVRLSTKNSRSQGKCTYRAPIGYLNEGNMDSKPLDPERAPIIKELFELYASGGWSISDLQRHAIKQGLTTQPMRRKRTREEMLSDDDLMPEKIARPILKSHIGMILRNQFYVGKVIGPNGKYIDSISHEALVTDDVFNQVQEMLSKKQTSVHYTEKLDHPLRGIVRCAYCERVYTPYTKKGIQYFNARCIDGCENTMKNCNFTYVAEKIKGLISGLHFTEAELEEFDSRAGTDIALLEHRRDKEIDSMERQKKTLREELAYLRANRLPLLKSGAYTPEGIVQELNTLQEKYDALHEEEAISEEAMREVVKEVITLSELIRNVVPIYDYANPHEKEKIIRVIFSELSISQDTLKYKLKKGFETFDKQLDVLCGPTRI